MFDPATLSRHARLVAQMGETTGTDLTAALEDGRMSGEEWRAAVIRCTGCVEASDCKNWLAEQDGTTDTPPAYCRNVKLFKALTTDL